jgi:hypothetical protein
MYANRDRNLWRLPLFAVSVCELERDSVGPGFSGTASAGAGATPMSSSQAGVTSGNRADAQARAGELARLPDCEATGDDVAICKRIVELAPMLTPEAAASEM